MRRSAAEAASRLRSAGEVVVATHIDADGISAAAIATTMLDRMGVRHSTMFFKLGN